MWTLMAILTTTNNLVRQTPMSEALPDTATRKMIDNPITHQNSSRNRVFKETKKALVTKKGRGPESFQENRTACTFTSTLARTSGAHSGRILHQSCYVKQRDEEWRKNLNEAKVAILGGEKNISTETRDKFTHRLIISSIRVLQIKEKHNNGKNTFSHKCYRQLIVRQ